MTKMIKIWEGMCIDSDLGIWAFRVAGKSVQGRRRGSWPAVCAIHQHSQCLVGRLELLKTCSEGLKLPCSAVRKTWSQVGYSNHTGIQTWHACACTHTNTHHSHRYVVPALGRPQLRKQEFEMSLSYLGAHFKQTMKVLQVDWNWSLFIVVCKNNTKPELSSGGVRFTFSK